MNLFDISINQLKRATAIKEQIEVLNKELRSILSGTAPGAIENKKTRAKNGFRRTRAVGVKSARVSVKPGPKPKKRAMSSAAKAKLSAKMKAYWAAKRAAKK